MKILKAYKSDIENVSTLFDLYRQFYGQPSDIAKARSFMNERFDNLDSVIFLALSDSSEPLGFVQLYPSFSSVAMKRMWYLNDLFVDESARNQGVAKALLHHVREFAKSTKALTVKLATATDNSNAKSLYESEGYVKVTAFDHYTQKVAQE